ncbi:hypothetical protein PG990_006822 [Apiospora arundinis]
MEPRKYQAIYNLSHRRSPSVHDEFPQFPRLPAEIRMEIWRQALRRNRLINVSFRASNKPRGAGYVAKTGLAKKTGVATYCLEIPGLHIYSKLLRVNREARSEALRFYRVHLPCHIWTEGMRRTDPGVEAVIYLSPEYDIIHLERIGSPMKDTLVAFFYNMKTCDPKGVGLLNLAVDRAVIVRWCMLDLDCLDPPAREAYVATLSQLREVFWITYTNRGQISGHAQCVQKRAIGVRFDDEGECFPIMTLEPVFERLRRDPRPNMAREPLSQTTFTPLRYNGVRPLGDPRETQQQGREALSMSDVVPLTDTKTQYWHLMAQRPQLDDIWAVRDGCASGSDEEVVLPHESDDWHGETAKLSELGRLEGCEPSPAKVDAAFGFWIFPAGEEKESHSFNGEIRISDISEQWPELGLSVI